MAMLPVLRKARRALFGIADATGVSRMLSDSSWRRHRLLILCYHGVSEYDEHQWADVYITPERLRQRMQMLSDTGCNVLHLSEALSRLQSGTLPDRAVAITFDDGMHDFFSVAFPIVDSFAFPVTLYLTTYYVEFNRPVFDPMCSYLLWKGRHKELLEWPEVFASPVELDDAGRKQAEAAIKRYALDSGLSGADKDKLLARLATHLDIDYEDLCQKRLLHLITPQEANVLASRGVDIEYHTHRHRVYRSRERMFAELEDNRRRIVAYTSREPHHFCYTSGFYLPEYPAYLKEYGILSATTCFRGLCSARTDPLLLPRLADGVAISDVEFRAWLAGTAGLLPQRHPRIGGYTLMEQG